MSRWWSRGWTVIKRLPAFWYTSVTTVTSDTLTSSRGKTPQTPPAKKRQKLALRYVHTHGLITDKQYQAITGTSEHTALRDLAALTKRGSLRVASHKGERYYVL